MSRCILTFFEIGPQAAILSIGEDNGSSIEINGLNPFLLRISRENPGEQTLASCRQRIMSARRKFMENRDRVRHGPHFGSSLRDQRLQFAALFSISKQFR